MDKSPAHTTRSTIIFFPLLAVTLSGCAYFTETDDSPVNCPVAGLPKNHPPFNSAAQKRLEQLIKRANNTSKDSPERTVFVRLNKQGTPLTGHNNAPGTVEFRTAPWPCVKDRRTGLTWESKTNDLSLHDKRWTYTWYEPTQISKGNYAGKTNGGKCPEGNDCDTQAYVAAVNAKKLCGYEDWRLPNIFELHTLLNRKDNCPGTCTDKHYFPNTAKGGYWSSSPFEKFICYAWGVDFELGDASGAHKDTPLYIRLVRGEMSGSVNNPENTHTGKKLFGKISG